MNLSNETFYSYFSRQIDKSAYINQLGVREEGFLKTLFMEIDKVIKSQNAERLEYLIHALFIWSEVVSNTTELTKYIESINNLLMMNWHNQHENLVDLIQKISDESSLHYLEKAIDIRLDYMEWDDNYSFEKKCVRAIYHIGKQEAKGILQRVTKSDIAEISKLAKRELGKLNTEMH